MRKALNTKEEDILKDSADSDIYCLDNLDLLNLPVSFSSHGTSKSDQKSRKKEQPNNSELFNKGDGYNRHPQRRCQHYRNTHVSGSGDYSQQNILLTRPKPTRRVNKSESQIVSEAQDQADHKRVLLLYSDQDSSPNQPISKDKFYTEERKVRLRSTLKPPKVHTVDIHSVSKNMAHRSSRKRSPSKESKPGEGGSFPFQVTPSGNFKVNSHQVVFESQKLSVLVADPEHTKVNIHPESFLEQQQQVQQQPQQQLFPPPQQQQTPKAVKMNAPEKDLSKRSVMESIMGQGPLGGSLGSLIASTAPVNRERESSEYEGKITDQILDPELNLNRLGYTALEPIDWNQVKLPEKTNLYLELYQRITNYTNADCKVYIDNEQFNCHLIVLQCYSEVFDEYVAVKKVELPSDKVGTTAFAFIYEWMITGEPAYTELSRDSVLDVFNAAKYLKIKDLTEQCWAFIDNTDVFSEDTAFMLYMDAKHKDLEDVRELMLPRIQKFFLLLVSSQDWLDLDKHDVMDFLNSNYICVNCEMEIYMSAIRWLKHCWEERQEDVLEILGCIRFGNIAPWQLVDIKRNPENPDFLKLASIPEICKMIDDGLAFVIIKYWYGQENDDFQHWNNILGLQEPPPRNWSGMDKTYFTYREFLIYLDQYRRNQMIERSKPRERKQRPSVDIRVSPKQPSDKVPPRIPTMDEFLSNRKANEESSPKGHAIISKHHAATIIQAAFRGYLVRQMLKQFVPTLKVRSPREKQLIIDDKFEPRASTVSHQTNFKVLSMFAQPRRFIRGQLNDMSASILPPTQKDYLTETSLFNADRESVLVFGGIDPHSNYGTARNTGKDVYRYLPDSNIWEYVGELPEPRHHHSVTFLKGRVYLCGGADPRDDDIKGKSVVVDTVWSFEPIKRSWFSEGSLTTPRKNFGLVTSNYTIYAIGGQDRQGRTLASVEKFLPEFGSWEIQAPLKNPRMGVACTKYRNFIWAAGGMSGSKKNPLSDSVECYDVKKNQWTEITKLRFPRCFGRMFSMSDRLYLIGGAGKLTEKEKTTTSVSAIDTWDPTSMEWKHQTDMAIPRHGHAIAYLGTQILIIGGVTTVYMRALSNTECYCTERGTWVRGIACLPTTLSGHAAVTLPPASLL